MTPTANVVNNGMPEIITPLDSLQVDPIQMETPANAITLTERAVAELNDLILSQDKQGAALRVWVAGGGCSGLSYGMALDDNAPEADDQVFHQDGLKVMVDELSLGYMNGAVVDYVDDVLGGGFKVENPQATGGCGCGNSFSTDGSAAGGGCGSGCGSGGCGSH